MTQEFKDAVTNSFGPKSTPKSRRILGSLIQQIQDFARENFITTDEWLTAVDFIKQIGQMSDIKRNEGISVSDVSGLEALVDTQTHSTEKHYHTSSANIGPVYRADFPKHKSGESII